MNSLYGNIISHIPRSVFNISLIYPNAAKMFESVDADNKKVPLYGYVLVDYHYPNEENTSTDENGLYKFNNERDQLYWSEEGKWIVNYDQTIWQKCFRNNKLTYRAIAKYNSSMVTFPQANHFQGVSAATFQNYQRLNAMPLSAVEISQDYEDFGITQYNEQVISFDKNAVEIFNARYPETPDENSLSQNKNDIPMQVQENNPSVSLANSSAYKDAIDEQIVESINKIQASSTVLSNNFNTILNVDTENIAQQYTIIATNKTNIDQELNNIDNNIAHIEESVEIIGTNITNINNSLTVISDANDQINTILTEHLPSFIENNLTGEENNSLNANLNDLLEDVSSSKENIEEWLGQDPENADSKNIIDEKIENIKSQCDIILSCGEQAQTDIAALQGSLPEVIEYIDLDDLKSRVQSSYFNDCYSNLSQSTEELKVSVEALSLEANAENIEDVVNRTQRLDTDTANMGKVKTYLDDVEQRIDNIILGLENYPQPAIGFSFEQIDNSIKSIKEDLSEISEKNSIFVGNILNDLENFQAKIVSINTLVTNAQEELNTYITNLKIQNNKIVNERDKIGEYKGILSDNQSNIEEEKNNLKDSSENIADYMININAANEIINTSNNNIKKLTEENITKLAILLEESEDLAYYTEMKTWYLDIFLPSIKTLSIKGLPESLKYFNTDTLEYPTK